MTLQTTMFAGGACGARLSADRRYRYLLWRTVDPAIATRVLFVMLNPSTADEGADDQTIRRCVGFARAWGFGMLNVVNLFALRSTDPRALVGAEDPVGPENDAQIAEAAKRSSRVVVAWGAHKTMGRDAAVLRLLRENSWDARSVVSLGTTKDGHPRHPLYVPAATSPAALVAKEDG